MVSLEPAIDASGGYVATLQTPLAPAATVAAPTAAADDAGYAIRILTEKGAAGFFDLNLATGQVHFSPPWKKILGYTPRELPDTIQTWRHLIHPDDSAAAPDKVSRKTVPGPRAINVEFRMQHRLGHWVWIQCVGLQQVGTPGKVDRVVGLHLDITERKELEDSLAANDARLQDLSGAGPLAAFELDFAHDHFWFSPAWKTLLGYAEDELPPSSDSFAAALPPEEASVGVAEWLLNRAPGQTSWVEPAKLQAKDGRAVPVLFGAHRTVSRKRELQRVVGFACALPAGVGREESGLPPEIAATVLRTIAEGVLITDARGRVMFANAVAARLLHSDPVTLCGQPLGDVFRLVDRQSGRPGDNPIDVVLAADHPLGLISHEALAPYGDGEGPAPIVWTARETLGPDGKPRGIVIVFRNPEEMTLTRDELIRADRFGHLGLLASGIAHDFNNLLTTILGAVDLALRQPPQYSSLGDADQACMAAKGLTQQLLAIARGDSRVRTVCAPKGIVEDAKKIAAAGSEADISIAVPDDVENVLVDRGQMLQVLQNLIVNALQAMPPPPHRPRLQIKVRNAALDESPDSRLTAGTYVEFEVADNGSGIKPEHEAKIWDPFFTTKKHGTGLGLATVLSIVRQHGGDIALRTKVGEGTVFTLYLPKAEAPVVRNRGIILMPTVRTHRVLFMDDDQRIKDLTVAMLRNLGYSCDPAKNGDEAIALFKRYVNLGRPHYDAVIMDLTIIGGMGGEECFRELRKLDPNVRAIVASGYDNEDIRRRFFDLGFVGYLAKPYRQTELGRVLKEVVG